MRGLLTALVLLVGCSCAALAPDSPFGECNLVGVTNSPAGEVFSVSVCESGAIILEPLKQPTAAPAEPSHAPKLAPGQPPKERRI